MERKAWFCPACRTHHAPHCDTCPEPVQVRPLPGITVPPVYPVIPRYWEPLPEQTPWTPYYPVTSVSTVSDEAILMNSVGDLN